MEKFYSLIFRVTCFVAVLVLCSLAAFGNGGGLAARAGVGGATDHVLEEALKTKYELTKTGIDRLRITQPGTVLVIRKQGISSDLSGDMTFLDNKVEGGRVAQASGFGASLANKVTNRDLKIGDKVYVFKIDVKDDKVQFFLITCDTYDVNVHGSTRQTRYKALVSFDLGKEFMSTATADIVKKAVDEVLVPEAEASAVQTKSVELGQTPEQVEAALGKPETVVKLGAKMTYVYKSMKVIFQDGKVADVQ